MARTQGHGNPHWTRDETILALDLYLKRAPSMPSKTSNDVIELSEVLRSLPYHSREARNPTFRNADGVAFKLLNLRNVATGKGLKNVSATDRQVWKDFGGRPERVAELAALIRTGLRQIENEQSLADAPNDKEYEFVEGRVLTGIHRGRERNPKVRKKLILERLSAGRLKCEVCDAAPRSKNESFFAAEFEAHHILPIAATLERKTKLSDMALVCACCHRLIHRAIALEKRWLTIDEARALIKR
jgi:5-methylcytosine-specific restriction protein A